MPSKKMRRRKEAELLERAINEQRQRAEIDRPVPTLAKPPGASNMISHGPQREGKVVVNENDGVRRSSVNALASDAEGDEVEGRFPVEDRWLKESVWFAFLNRAEKVWIGKNGTVTSKAHVAERYREHYVEVEPFSPLEDRSLLQTFVEDRLAGQAAQLLEFFDAEEWNELKETFRAAAPELLDEYQRRRAAKIAEHVRLWCGKNGVTPEVLFYPQGMRAFAPNLNRDQDEEISNLLETATRNGQYAVVAVAYRDTDAQIRLLLSDIAYLTTAFTLVDREYLKTGAAIGLKHDRYHLGHHFADPEILTRLSKEMSHGLMTTDIPVKGASRFSILRRIRQAGASHFRHKGFGLIDICGFSAMQSAQQLQSLLALNLAVKRASSSAKFFCQELGVENAFARVSTGDGFYLWHTGNRPESDIATFTYILAIAAQVQALKDARRSDVRVKLAFTVGEVFSFYEAPVPTEYDEPSIGLNPNAVGPATNHLARLVAGCRPGQFLVGDFRRPWEDVGSLTPQTMINRVRAALLPRELVEFDGTWHKSSELQIDPQEEAFLVADKHGDSIRCWNINGRIQARMGDMTEVGFFDVGLKPEKATRIEDRTFLF